MQRVMIVGGPGSGKSTLAVRLGEATGLPVFHMDKIHYLPGWVERQKSEKSALTLEVHALEQWIFEGGHSTTYAQRVARADLFIWLDIPIWKRIFRVLRRSYIHRGQIRPDMQDDCPEQFNWQTFEFLGFIIRTRNTARAMLKNIYEDHTTSLRVVKLTNQTEIDLLVENAKRAVSGEQHPL